MIGTGHSLGAGLASVGGPWFALQWPGADVNIVTFGEPMVRPTTSTEPMRHPVAILWRLAMY